MRLNFYTSRLSVNVVRSLAVNRTRVGSLAYAWQEGKIRSGAGAGLDRVERQDEGVMEAVQRSLRSRFYERGGYSTARKQGVHDFHRLVASPLSQV